MKEGRNDGQVFQGLILSLGGAGGRWSKQILGMREKYSRFMMGHTNHKDSAFMRDIVTSVFTYDKESSGKSPIAGFIYSKSPRVILVRRGKGEA